MLILPDSARGGNDRAHNSGDRPAGGDWCGWALLCLLLWLVPAVPASAGDADAVAVALRQRIGELRASGRIEVQGVVIGAQNILAEFYARRAYQPAWGDPARVAGLQAMLERATEHGLDPGDFFASRLKDLVQTATGPEGRADLDLLLTEALIRYGYQRRFGKVNPVDMDPAWNFRRGFDDAEDPVATLAQAVAAPSLAQYLDARLPGSPWYHLLQAGLARYRAMAAAGGWPVLPEGPVLRPGDRAWRVPLLRQRLQVEGDLPAEPPPDEPELFDPALAAAVMRFQERHSLGRDGVVGAMTLAALNVPVQARIDQLRLSLERVRWLTGDVPGTYVVVNVAGFRAGYVRDHRLVWNSRVVVGRTARQTPIFRGRMTYIEINPTWTIPPTILREDVLPRLRRDPGYLAREHISVLDGRGRRVDPASVDWTAVGRNVPYTLRQEPGPDNALGRIKLMFPNPHMVYLHDTPARALFDRPERSFSSGCIRVEDPLALAVLVLDDPRWDRPALEAAIATGETRQVPLRIPVPVLIVYLTSIADPSGTVHFFRDVYGRDAPLLAALNGPVRLELPVHVGAAGAPARPAAL